VSNLAQRRGLEAEGAWGKKMRGRAEKRKKTQLGSLARKTGISVVRARVSEKNNSEDEQRGRANITGFIHTEES
jgi:hypothetical protein